MPTPKPKSQPSQRPGIIAWSSLLAACAKGEASVDTSRFVGVLHGWVWGVWGRALPVLPTLSALLRHKNWAKHHCARCWTEGAHAGCANCAMVPESHQALLMRHTAPTRSSRLSNSSPYISAACHQACPALSPTCGVLSCAVRLQPNPYTVKSVRRLRRPKQPQGFQ